MSDALPDPVRSTLDALKASAEDGRSGWRWPVLSTVDAQGRPHSRILVVRHFDPEASMIEMHSDKRAGKIDDLDANCAVSLLFFNNEEKIQVRIEGRARVLTGQDDGLEEAWSRAPQSSWPDYAGEPAPGEEIDGPGPIKRETGEDGERARENFAAIQIKLRRADWLMLTGDGHRRAEIDFSTPTPSKVWTAP